MTNRRTSQQVLMVVNTYAVDDARVIFSADLLTQMGYQVQLVGSARNKDNTTIQSQQSHNKVMVRVLPHVTTVGNMLKIIIKLLTNRLPQSVPTSLEATNLISMFVFNLLILRIGLFRPLHVVHCHDLSPLPACWLISVIKRIPLIYDIHENVPTMYKGRKGKIMARLERMLVPQTDYVISAGHRLAQAMLGRGAKQVIHIGNWKPLEQYDRITDADTKRLREQWQIPQEAFVISFLGTLDKNRELPQLLDAVASLENVYLMIAGRGEYQTLVQEYARQHDNIIWLEWVDLEELPLYTVAADIMYYCRSDSMLGGSYELAPAPNKLYEAFAAGLPLIATKNVGEIGELLEDIPAAILLDEVTPETVRDAIIQLMQAPIYQPKREAALGARDVYNLAKAEEYLGTVYETVIGS